MQKSQQTPTRPHRRNGRPDRAVSLARSARVALERSAGRCDLRD